MNTGANCRLVSCGDDFTGSANAREGLTFAGLSCALPRRTQCGPDQTEDLKPFQAWDIVAEDLVVVAERIVC